MSAAARLLRRRSSLHLQQYRSSLRLLSPYLPNNSTVFSKSIERNRVFSVLADEPPEKSPRKRNGLKYAAVGAAVVFLSAAAWYTTREQQPLVQHVGLPLPLIWNKQPLEEKTARTTDESVSSIGAEKDDAQPDEHQTLNLTPGVPEVGDLDKTTQGVTRDVDEQGYRESAESSSQENEDAEVVEIRGIPEDVDLYIVEREQAFSPAGEAQPSEQMENEKTHGTQGEEVKVHAAEREVDAELEEIREAEYLVTEEEKEAIRKKVQEENPDLFYSDDEDRTEESRSAEKLDREETESKEEPLLEEVMGAGISEHGAAPQRVPSSEIVSHNAQNGNNGDSEKYSKSGEENVTKDVDAAEISKEGNTQINAEEEMEQKAAKVVGVDVLLGAIRTAEQMQAERDHLAFEEQLEKIQEAHKSEVKDFQAKVFAYAQDRDRLEKEMKKEKELAEAELKLQLHKAEEKLESQLKRKDEEASKEREKLVILGKAEAAAAVARERAEHLENIHAVQQHINALRTAFYTRSEEAHVSHTAHKLAMGAFALEDAIERGDPIKKETELLVASAGGPGGDPLVDAVVSSIPPETLTAGSWTRGQIQNMFTKLKRPMRELVLMPAGGGGVFAHLLAKITAHLKIPEQGSDNVSGEGFEVVIGKVERYLTEGKLIEAATILEGAAVGTAAEHVATEWARQARNRAIIEQGLQVLQAHVTAIASGLS
ncbi:hypothetical protein R1flu_018097 [Riccia fluitans]|uniref:MICOS complex subunit MIC60 n=1 Tax=Riccia fluitans TaxID=41844 RepID=A0ABD1ZIS8_9MARC